MTRLHKAELLAPAGNLEKLKVAVLYGADAVYMGAKKFGLRQGADNFTREEMEEGLDFLHQHGCKGYLTLNIMAHEGDLAPLEAFLQDIQDLPFDGYLVTDPGVLCLLKSIIPHAEIHLSTQASMTNSQAARFWYQQGVRRVVTARELSLEEITALSQEIPEDMEVESFVHGAMCISYSGRCLLSNVMTGRDANQGNCAHPCRWRYTMSDSASLPGGAGYVLEEDNQPGEYYPAEEDERGTYIFNSRDLCMVEHLAEMLDAGVSSFKIEGRIKSIYYLAVTVATYRKALDAALAGKREADPTWIQELGRASNRGFTTGFYYGKPNADAQNYRTSAYHQTHFFTGVVREYQEDTGLALVEQRNKMVLGETFDILYPDGHMVSQTLEFMTDEEGNPVESCPHPKQRLYIKMEQPVPPLALLRTRKE